MNWSPTCTNSYNSFGVELYSLQVISFLIGFVPFQLPENAWSLPWLFLLLDRSTALLLTRDIASSGEGWPGCWFLLLGRIIRLKWVHEAVIEEVLKAREESCLVLIGRSVLRIILLWYKSRLLLIEGVGGRRRVIIPEPQSEWSNAEVHLNLINIIVI